MVNTNKPEKDLQLDIAAVLEGEASWRSVKAGVRLDDNATWADNLNEIADWLPTVPADHPDLARIRAACGGKLKGYLLTGAPDSWLYSLASRPEEVGPPWLSALAVAYAAAEERDRWESDRESAAYDEDDQALG